MQWNRAKVVLIAGLVLTLSISGTARAQAQVACPPTISVEQKATAPNEWSVDYSKMPASLDSATIFEGPPEEEASLKYDEEHTGKTEIVQTWTLPKSDRGYWLVCGYANTSAQLRHKLPDDVGACEVILEKNMTYGNGGAVVKRAECRSHKPTQ